MKIASLLAIAAMSFAGASTAAIPDLRLGSLSHQGGGPQVQRKRLSYAHVKRQAQKARNVARHKAHCKGGSSRKSRGCRA